MPQDATPASPSPAERSGPVIWLAAGRAELPAARELGAALAARGARPVVIGPAMDQGGPDLALAEGQGLDQALLACPPELRPGAAACLAPAAPRGLDCLAAPVMAWRGGAGLEGGLPPAAGEAADALIKLAGRPFQPAWMDGVQVNLPLRDLLGRYRALAQAWPLHLEVGVDALALEQVGPAEMDQARALLAGRRLTSHLPFHDLCPGSVDPAIARLSGERLLAGAEMAVALGATQAVAHLGFHPVLHRDREDFTRRWAAAAAPAAQVLDRAGGCLLLENVFEPDPGVHLMLLEALEETAGVRAGLCLDAGHALAFSPTGLEEWWAAFAPRLGELHLHDNLGQGDDHLPLGWGLVDWGLMRQGLAGLAAWPVITLEPHEEPHLWATLRGLERLWGAPPGSMPDLGPDLGPELGQAWRGPHGGDG